MQNKSKLYYFVLGTTWFLSRWFSKTIFYIFNVLSFIAFILVCSYFIGHFVFYLLSIDTNNFQDLSGTLLTLKMFIGFTIFVISQRPLQWFIGKIIDLMKKESIIQKAIKKGQEIQAELDAIEREMEKNKNKNNQQ